MARYAMGGTCLFACCPRSCSGRRGMPENAICLFLLVTGLAACGGRTSLLDATGAGSADSGADSGAIHFPVGTFTGCAEGFRADNGLFLNGAGFEAGASVTLAQSAPGSALNARYVNSNGKVQSFSFAVTSETSAALAPAGQIAGFTGYCVPGMGVSNEVPFSGDLHAGAGALTVQAGAVFVSAAGVVKGDGSPCGAVTSPGSWWLLCRNGPAREPGAGSAGPAVPAWALAPLVGSYACSFQLGTRYHDSTSGVDEYVTGPGGSGTLTLDLTGAHTESRAVLSAVYRDSAGSAASWTLSWKPTTAITANIEPRQSASVLCDAPLAVGEPPPSEPETMPIDAGSLSLDGSTLILSFTGVMGASSSCAGAEKAGALVCTKR